MIFLNSVIDNRPRGRIFVMMYRDNTNMYIPTNEKFPDGTSMTVLRKLWGVSYRPEKREDRKEFADRYTNEATAKKYFESQALVTERILCGESHPMDKVTQPFYIASIRILDVTRYIGATATPQKAARYYDAALFYCWGFIKKPRSDRFNYFQPTGDNFPEMDKDMRASIQELKSKLYFELRQKTVEPTVFDFNYNDREKLEGLNVK